MEDGLGGEEDGVEAIGVMADQKASSAVDVTGGHRLSSGDGGDGGDGGGDGERRRFVGVEDLVLAGRGNGPFY